MAEQLYFSRDSKLYMEFAGGVWEIPVLDGFSFSQSTNTSDITLNEMQGSDGLSRRGRRLFTDSLAPAEWSFSTYIRPYIDGSSNHHAVEEALWALFGGADTYTPGTPATLFSRTIQPDTNGANQPNTAISDGTDLNINFEQSNRSVLGTCNLYFVMETSATNPMVYKLSGAAINEASIDFEVDGIATINWSGFAATITDLQSQAPSGGTPAPNAGVVVSTTAPGTAAAGSVHLDSDADFAFTVYPGTYNGAVATTSTGVAATDTGVDSTKTFIRNRLTQLLVNTTDTAAFPSGSYNLTLTGGNVTISNNITYLVPEELGNVNVPIEHVTGARTVTGNFTCYLNLDTAGPDTGTSVDLFNDMTTVGQGLDKVVNDFDVTFQIGGSVAATPRLYVNCPKAHIEVPVHSVEDVISVETGFGAYTDDFNIANELTLQYFGVAL